MYTEKLPGELRPEQDPTKCYVCEAEAMARCTRCNMPICDEHQQETHSPVTKLTVVLCDDCADYYEGLLKPD